MHIDKHNYLLNLYHILLLFPGSDASFVAVTLRYIVNWVAKVMNDIVLATSLG